MYSMPRPASNPANRFHRATLEWDEPPPAELEVYEERAKSILSRNDSPDVGFEHSVNPYRGCFHACAYCYARPTHPYLDFGAGTDFDRKIVVKTNAPELLATELGRPGWKGGTIAFSGNTDCYQPLEARYGLTRRCLEVCLDYRNPVTVITKGLAIRRDVDVLAALAEKARCRVTLSIPFANDADARAIEPFASPPSKRFETLRILSEAGIRTGVSVSPIIPGLNDHQIPEILERAREAGATHAFCILLRLPREVLPIFDERLEEAFPLRAEKVRHALAEMRGGARNESAFGERMRGKGVRWQLVERLFESQAKRLGFGPGVEDEGEPPTTFRRPTPQLALFDER